MTVVPSAGHALHRGIPTFNRFRRDSADVAIRDQLRQAADALADALARAASAAPSEIGTCQRDVEQASANLRAIDAGLRAMVARDIRARSAFAGEPLRGRLS